MKGQKIIDFARTFLGMTYDLANNIIFITEYYGQPKNKRIAYCCMFVWYIYKHTGNAAYFYGGNKTASCTTLLNYYKSKHPNWVHKNPARCKPGKTIVFYNFDSDAAIDHVGIYDSYVSDTYFYAIEGNTTNKLIGGSQSNGGYVMRKKRNIKNVKAFVNVEIYEPCPYAEPTSTVSKGTKGNDAGWVQWQLDRKGYYCQIDESIGSKSVELIKKFQADNKLTVDGKVGRITRGMLRI